MNEIWKDIENYEGLYHASNLGRIKSLNKHSGTLIDKDGILKETWNTKHTNYKRVGLHKNGKTKTLLVHRFVAKTFVQNPENKPIVNHTDEDKFNNVASNLCWFTKLENNVYGSCKEQIKTTRRLSKAGYVPVVQLSISGEYINEFDSAKSAALHIGHRSPSITSCCKHRPKYISAYGFKWMYKSEYLIKTNDSKI